MELFWKMSCHRIRSGFVRACSGDAHKGGSRIYLLRREPESIARRRPDQGLGCFLVLFPGSLVKR
jgi:hypothetical protein